MAQVKHGNKSVLFFREWKEVPTEDGAKLSYQVEHSIDYNNNLENLITKDGVVPIVTAGENTLSVTSYAYDEDDGGIALWETLFELFKKRKKVEIWDVETGRTTESGEYKVTYFRGFFTSVSVPKTSEGAVELSFEYAIEGEGAGGTEILSPSQVDAIESALYEYESLKALDL